MRTAIVEIRESHEECIYSQLRFLKDAGHWVTLILHPILAQQISEYENLADETLYFDFEQRDFLKKIHLQWRLYGLLNQFDRVVFNTAHSYSVLRNLSVLLRFARTECIGIMHDTKKLDSSPTQRTISRKVKKYFVLNDALLPESQKAGDVKLQSFYPIFFPDYEPIPLTKQDEIWIGIPGRLDYGRREYDFLIDALRGITVLKRMKFIMLGEVDRDEPAGKRLFDRLEKSGQSGRFKLFQFFVPNRDFHAYLKACDYVMPLLRPNKEYLNHKISGSFNLAFAYKKPLLCRAFFKDIPDLAANSLFFDKATFPKLISDLDSGNVTAPDTYADPNWDYAFQQKRYLDFIKG
jgi:hypothetical protein